MTNDCPRTRVWPGSPHPAEDDRAHQWVAGLWLVPPEDLERVAAARRVTCLFCDEIYAAHT